MDSKTQWLEQRQKGIGGSDAPVIVLGEYFGKNVQDLFYEKINPVQPSEPTADMRRGIRQEPIAAKVFEEKSGLKVRQVTKILKHPEFDFMLANIDREILNQDAILEIKCPRYMTYSKWKREGIPEGPIIQGQHYLAVKGKGKVIFGVFCAEVDEMMIVPVERDNNLIDLLINKEGQFWRYVEAKELPPVEKTEIDLPAVGGEIVKIETPGWIKAVENLRVAKELKSEAEAIEADAKDRIQKIMETVNSDVVEGAGARIYWREQAGRKRFNKKRLIAEHPEIDISQYETEGKPFKVFKSYFLTNPIE